ncbi:TRAP-type mannitol/chloroaromatic compound transport system permease large subunit [Limibacillus halophilus]|uniref:TRAP-type mannitol/chloroaromatic compound transport system permease large subunit n=2 Tax=Limibacillus halophilus TaxID=1579333 RepID=A0A839SUI5_9PROT|nr:TRAP-type mannitol/chloroaromatic compound transport system permease large subunit [Limibacillus halophilus]
MTLPLDLMMFAALIACILLGFPVSFSIAGVATLFAVLGWVFGVMDISLLGALGQRVFGLLTNTVLIAIPLFVLMGVILQQSHIAEDLLETMGRLFGRLRGGLGVSVVLVGALLAASTGIVGATVIAMGMIALPTMLRNRYNPELASGIVCTAGTLGQIIPPSTLLIILSDVMSNAYQQAQFAQGKFTVETISVGQIFAGALLPGLTLVVIYILYVLGRAWLLPNDAPAAVQLDDKPSALEVAIAVLPPVLLIVAVLGAILGGVATPTEAASVGAIGALLMAGHRLGAKPWLILAGAGSLLLLGIVSGLAPVHLQRSDAGTSDWVQGGLYAMLALLGMVAIVAALKRAWTADILKPALTSTMTVTSMIFATILTASMFSLVFVGLGGEARIEQILTAMPGGATGALIFCMALIFVLGFFLDFVEITVIVLPLIAPMLILMGHDPIWLAILIAINLQTSFLTPPFGFSLFYLRGAAPPEITTGQIYAGVAPFILLQIVGVAIIWMIPAIPTWLPSIVF